MPEAEKTAPAPAAPAAPPEEIELTEVEVLKLALITTTVGKIQAEAELIQVRMAEMAKGLKERQARMQELSVEHRQALEETAARLGISPAILSQYNIDLAEKKGHLRPPQQGGR